MLLICYATHDMVKKKDVSVWGGEEDHPQLQRSHVYFPS